MLVPVGSTRTIEFVADEPGDWALHVLEVRNQLASYRDPGWYENPPGTLAEAAQAADLGRDAVDVSSPPKAERGGDA